MGHVSNKPDQQRHFMPLSMPVRNISYLLIYTHVGKGLPTYCISRTVGRQPLAANYFKT